MGFSFIGKSRVMTIGSAERSRHERVEDGLRKVRDLEAHKQRCGDWRSGIAGEGQGWHLEKFVRENSDSQIQTPRTLRPEIAECQMAIPLFFQLLRAKIFYRKKCIQGKSKWQPGTSMGLI